MKTQFKVLTLICLIMAFAVAGSLIADPFVAGSIGLAVTQVPVVMSFALGATIIPVTGTSNDYRKQQAEILRLLQPLQGKKLSEFSEEERKLWEEKYPEFETVTKNLELALQQEEVARRSAALNGLNLSATDLKDISRYSFRKAILMSLGQMKLEGFEAEMHAEAIKEAREAGRSITGIGVPYLLLSQKPLNKRASTGQNVATAADGGYLVQDEPMLYFDALRNKLVLPGMGAKFITGLVGDLPLVEGGSFTASWLAEDGEDTTTKAAFDEFVMQPKRLQCTGALSHQLLRQTSLDAERLIEEMLIAAHAQGLQLAAINGSGTAPEPRGILNKVGIGSVAGGDNGLAPAWSHIIKLETEVAIDNADGPSMAYLTNAKVRGKLKQVEKAANTAQFVWDKNEMNGYPALVSNAVPSNLDKGTSEDVCSAIIFGDWSKLFIGQWGNIDIIADPYSLKKKAEVEVTAISYGDIGILQPEGFAAMKDALTA